MQTSLTQTKIAHPPAIRGGKPGQPSRKLADWRPETSSISRDELRRIVRRALG